MDNGRLFLMKKILLGSVFLILLDLSAASQLFPSFGLKAGANFSNVSNASSFKSDNASGFMLGAWLGSNKKLISFRTEGIFSRQGYDFRTNTDTGTVQLDYLIFPQLLSLNLGKYLTLQAGGQLAFLLNANVDSTSGNNGTFGNIMDFLNRFDYGFAVGAEVCPYRGWLLGVRYNRSLNDLWNSVTYSGGQINFASPNLKNNVVQVYTGWRFGK